MRLTILFMLMLNVSMVLQGRIADLPEILKETPLQHEARMNWWHDAKFGMFIHWGVYAIPGKGEWVQWNQQIPVEEYAKFADEWSKMPEMLPAIDRKIRKASCLSDGKVTFSQSQNGLKISVCGQQEDQIDTIIKLELASKK